MAAHYSTLRVTHSRAEDQESVNGLPSSTSPSTCRFTCPRSEATPLVPASCTGHRRAGSLLSLVCVSPPPPPIPEARPPLWCPLLLLLVSPAKQPALAFHCVCHLEARPRLWCPLLLLLLVLVCLRSSPYVRPPTFEARPPLWCPPHVGSSLVVSVSGSRARLFPPPLLVLV